MARLSEENQEIRGEALVGLARRQHPDTIKFLIKELNSSSINVLMLETAEILANVELYPLLLAWKEVKDKTDNSYFEGMLEEALAACSSSTFAQ